MSSDQSEQDVLNKLSIVAPIARGLLAELSGNEDMPYVPVLLECSAGRAKNKEVLSVSVESDSTDAIKKQLQEAIDSYKSQNGSKPSRLYIAGLGTLTVTVPAQADASTPLKNKVALVTGAAGAIGFGICKALLESGCHLAASDLPGEKLDGFVADMDQIQPGKVIGVAMDVTDKDNVEAGFRKVVQRWGGIDIVVHNAGIALVSTIKDMSLDAFRKLEKVNIEGTLLTIAEAARILTAQGIGGDIVIMSTKNVPSPSAGFGAYSATKAACHQLGRIASLEFAQHDIRVNMVAPDAVFAEGKYKSGLWQEVGTDRMKARGLDEKGLHEYYRSRNLLKAKVTGRHVANAVLFFVTRQTPTTGATIPVDGGLPDATPR